jgi:thiol-disulfide isomerase/thioredoxin
VPGERVPVHAPGLTGGIVAWDDYVGTPALLSVWAAWCPHCQAEMPVLERVMADHPDMWAVTVVTDRRTTGPTPGGASGERTRSSGRGRRRRGDAGGGPGVTGLPYFVNSDGTVALEMGGEVDRQTSDRARSAHVDASAPEPERGPGAAERSGSRRRASTSR